MRARYTAYVKRNIGFLVSTHDPETRSDFDPLLAAEWSARSGWTRLDILSKRRGGEADTSGEVEFIAWFTTAEGLSCHHEVSVFRRVADQWVYSGGTGRSAEVMLRSLGRNADCPCGSGRKFKKCHAV
jgi:SEC-C motif domain protein